MTHHIIATPRTDWCARCATAWTPEMIAVRVSADTRPTRLVCGACIMEMAAQVEAEQARRAEDKDRRVTA